MLLSGKVSQEAIESDIQLADLLPVTATWHHWWENDKTGCVVPPHHPIYRLHLLPDDRPVLRPNTSVFLTPAVNTICPQMEYNHSDTTYAYLARYYFFSSVFESFSTKSM